MNLREVESLSVELDQTSAKLWLQVVTFDCEGDWDLIGKQDPIYEDGEYGILFNPLESDDVPEEIEVELEEYDLTITPTSFQGSSMYLARPDTE